jgi:hypothetical protein
MPRHGRDGPHRRPRDAIRPADTIYDCVPAQCLLTDCVEKFPREQFGALSAQ